MKSITLIVIITAIFLSACDPPCKRKQKQQEPEKQEQSEQGTFEKVN